MKQFSLSLLFISLLTTSLAQTTQIIPLWPQAIPNSKASAEQEKTTTKGIKWVTQVHTPSIEAFIPPKRSATGQAVVICPGGGYAGLAYDWEGTEMAKFLNTKGVAAFVLKSRLPQSQHVVVPHLAPLQDAQRAMRLVRSRAKTWNVNPQQIGIMGASAGGHLASTLATHYNRKDNIKPDAIDTLSARPNFSILLYPVVSMKADFTHKGSRNKLLGKTPSEALVLEYANELHVDAQTPPCFIVHSTDDKVVPVENSIQYYLALRKAGVPAEMHIFPHGGHGYGLAINKGHLSEWPNLLHRWLVSLQ